MSLLHPEPGIVPALSLRQPWLWAVMHAGKRIENRDKRTALRGRLALHAAKSCEPAYYRDAVAWMVSRGLARHPDFTPAQRQIVDGTIVDLPRVPPIEELPRGVLVGVCKVVDVIAPGQSGESWHMPDKYGWRLADVEPVRHVKISGMPGLFPVHEHDLQPVRRGETFDPLVLPRRLERAPRVVCAPCSRRDGTDRPVKQVEWTRDVLTGDLTIRVECHGERAEVRYSAAALEAVTREVPARIEVFEQ